VPATDQERSQGAKEIAVSGHEVRPGSIDIREKARFVAPEQGDRLSIEHTLDCPVRPDHGGLTGRVPGAAARHEKQGKKW
jgi:hypothetical protein